MTPETPQPRIRIGVSACLLGEHVRFDGGHKRDRILTDVLGPHVEWVPVCPEVELGLGTPRETLRLVQSGRRVRLMMPKTEQDWTKRMQQFAARRVDDLARAHLCGYVLKADSPSCGKERVKLYSGAGESSRTGRGLFAEALLARCPLLPIEEETRLQDAGILENFIERLFAYRRLRTIFDRPSTHEALVEFHARHELVLMSHSPREYRRLGRMVAGADGRRRRLLAGYGREFMQTMAQAATPRRHTNVLLHVLEHLRSHLNPPARREALDAIRSYQAGLVPRRVPLTLLARHVREHSVSYLAGQVYVNPDPAELALRERV
jgi:uncharacterized protein YbbK (DUF523 family)/uncharacterized protein YbgA (DUF1722 family)